MVQVEVEQFFIWVRMRALEMAGLLRCRKLEPSSRIGVPLGARQLFSNAASPDSKGVAVQDFEKAGSLRDREMELKSQIGAITAGAKEGEAAEQDAGEGSGPLVTDQDIANIVAQWTGIPIEKVRIKCCLRWYFVFVGGRLGYRDRARGASLGQPEPCSILFLHAVERDQNVGLLLFRWTPCRMLMPACQAGMGVQHSCLARC